MAKEERIKVHKHFYIYHDQVTRVAELKEKVDVSPTRMMRIILDNFLGLPKEKQIKIIEDGRNESL